LDQVWPPGLWPPSWMHSPPLSGGPASPWKLEKGFNVYFGSRSWRGSWPQGEDRFGRRHFHCQMGSPLQRWWHRPHGLLYARPHGLLRDHRKRCRGLPITVCENSGHTKADSSNRPASGTKMIIYLQSPVSSYNRIDNNMVKKRYQGWLQYQYTNLKRVYM
jgi:hypothetical protein